MSIRFGPALLVGLLVGSLSPAQEMGHPYFPLKPGAQWTYRADDKKVVLRVVGVERVDDVSCAVLETKRPDGLAITEHVAVKIDGVYRFRAMRVRLEPAVCFLKFARPKEPTWKMDTTLGGDQIVGTCSLDDAEVMVPLGKFQTKRVTTQYKRGQQAFKYVSYFARDFGMVKQEQDLEGKRVLLELEKYDPGK